jgi:hypothetical protein
MNHIYTFGVAFTLILIQLGCSGSGADLIRNESTRQEQPAPLIELELVPKLRLKDRLVFKWRVLNNGSKPIFLFSSLLDRANASFVAFELNTEQKTIQVGFIRAETSSGFPPYSFPKIEFKQLHPGESLEGTFESDPPIAKLDFYVMKGDKLQKINLGSGVWSLQAAIAWNMEIDTVRQALQTIAKEGQEHPANAVTRWQRVAISQPVVIALEE